MPTHGIDASTSSTSRSSAARTNCELVRAMDVDRVIFAFSNDAHGDNLHLIRGLRESGVQVDIVPRLFEVIGPRVDIHSLEGCRSSGCRR